MSCSAWMMSPTSGDDLDRAGIKIVGTRRLNLAGLVGTLPAVRVREDGISRGKFAKGADGAAAIGMGALGLAAISPVDFVTGGIAPDPKNSIKVPHPPIPRTHSELRARRRNCRICSKPALIKFWHRVET